jgi:hypothetical protein
VEEALQHLRVKPLSLLACYYIGTLPFILGFLYFCADMSKSAFAMKRCAAFSLVLALLFIWMKCWQAVYVGKIMDGLSRTPARSWPPNRLVKLAAAQSIIQASGFIVLPVALLLTIPYGWCYAFYQNMAVFGDGREQNLAHAAQHSWAQAKIWPRQNVVILLVISGLGIIIFMNLAVVIYWLPQVLKRFLGIDSLSATSGIWFVLNTTFVAVTAGLTYLCVDPLVKVIYTLRCFYGSALKNGEDLRADLHQLSASSRLTRVGILLLIGVSLTFSAQPAAGENGTTPAHSGTIISPAELDRSIEDVLENPKYAWRLPRQPSTEKGDQQAGFLDHLVGWINNGLKTLARMIGDWLEKLTKLLTRLLPDSRRTGIEKSFFDLSTVLFLLLGAALILFGRMAWPLLKKRRSRQDPAPVEIAIGPKLPDMNDDYIKADEIAMNRWLLLAQELKEKGELRLALRALYLATLAHLAEQEFITIARFKSNYDYLNELRRRLHEKADLIALFQENNMMFDKIWYGSYPVRLPDLARFSLNHEQITAHASS